MKKHTKIYFDHFNIDYDIPTGYHDYIYCEVDNKIAVDIHHITFKSQGGKDNIENLIALCRDCHNKAHSGELPKHELEMIHLHKIMEKTD